MIRSLLVPLDGSRFSEQGLPLASRLAKATGADIHLARVHVHAPGLMVSNSPFPIENFDDGLREEGEYLSEIAQQLSREGSHADSSVLEGPKVAKSLSAYAGRVAADLVLIASHGRSGMGRLWFGSVADDLVRHTDLPVFITRPPRDGTDLGTPDVGRILVLLDGSDEAASVVAPAAELAEATGASLTLAHTAATDWQEASEYLEEIAVLLRSLGLSVSTHRMYSEGTGEAIARVARVLDADVIAMAVDAEGRLERALRGGLADELLRATDLPLLLVRMAVAA